MDRVDDFRDAELHEFYRDRPVAVTGGTGFVGSHLVELLVGYGARVTMLARASSRPVLPGLEDSFRDCTTAWGNLIDPMSVDQFIETAVQAGDRKLVVFHLAAQPHVGESWDRPYETFQVNAIGTIHLLEALRRRVDRIEKVSIAGTSEEFGNVDEMMPQAYTFRDGGDIIWNSNSPVNPQSPYATSKVACDYLARNYSSAYGVPIVVARMFNNFGPRQSPRFITGTTISQALVRGRVLLGNASATRDYTYVTDGARGHLYAAAFADTPVVTYGYGEEIDVQSWVERIVKTGEERGYWNGVTVEFSAQRERPGASEIRRLGVDSSAFTAATGWRPLIGRDDGIAATIDYFAATRENWIGNVDWR